MACRTDGPMPSSSNDRHRSEVAELMCKLCNWVIGTEPMAEYMRKELPDVWEWWQEHKKLDAEKLRREAEERRVRELRAAALGKLTAEELDSLTGLGLRVSRETRR